MIFRILIDGRPVEIEVTHNGEWCSFVLRSGGEETRRGTASLVAVVPGMYSVLLGGRSYDVRVETSAASSIVSLSGKRFAVQVEDPRHSPRRRGGIPGEGRQSVCAPMPGRVVKVLVKEGDAVEAGQGIVVVEAMKMQNEMKAPKAGRLVSLRAREGDAVSAGETLAEVQ